MCYHNIHRCYCSYLYLLVLCTCVACDLDLHLVEKLFFQQSFLKWSFPPQAEHCMCGLSVPAFLGWNTEIVLVPPLLVLGCGCVSGWSLCELFFLPPLPVFCCGGMFLVVSVRLDAFNCLPDVPLGVLWYISDVFVPWFLKGTSPELMNW